MKYENLRSFPVNYSNFVYSCHFHPSKVSGFPAVDGRSFVCPITVMTLLIDIKAFLVSARTGGLSAAAREINTTPSVITKRVNRLEAEVGTKLFNRSTRSLSLTPEGERLRPQLQMLVAELEETLANSRKSSRGVRGNLRMRAPTTVGAFLVGPSIARFQAKFPDITVDFLLMDRQVDPLEEGYDIVLGASPQSFAGVEETPLCLYPRILVAAPKYLDARGMPKTPADIVEHDCLTFISMGVSWTFVSTSGPIVVDIRSRFTANDSRFLVDAVLEGLGLAVVPEFLVRDAVKAGSLIPLLPDFPTAPMWFKATVPRHRAHKPEVVALLKHLQQEFDPPPWNR